MTELHSVFLKYNADRGAAVQEKEGRWEEGDATSHRPWQLFPCTLLVNQGTVGLTG